MATETCLPMELEFVFAVAQPDETFAPVASRPAQAEPEPELSIYRTHTIALLRRYMHLSIEIGRVPSLIGKETFHSHISYIRPHTFEDAVHFVIDVEHCLEQLDDFSQRLLARVVLQEYSWDEAARLLGVCRRSVANALPMCIDRLTELLLERKILQENGQK